MPLYLFAIFAVIVIAASMYDIIPKEITGALAVMFILGIIFGEVEIEFLYGKSMLVEEQYLLLLVLLT